MKSVLIKFITNYGSFKKGEVIVATKENNGYKHIFWRIPESVVVEVQS
ncbi:MAG: hypothetical protein ACTSR2_00840 [Candidatus Hodarchaeales archaeon]